MGQRAFHRRRLARTQLFVYIDQQHLPCSWWCPSAGWSGADVHRLPNISEILPRPNRCPGTDKGRDRDLAVFIYADIDHIVGIHFIFQPCATVRDNGSLKQILTGAILFQKRNKRPENEPTEKQ